MTPLPNLQFGIFLGGELLSVDSESTELLHGMPWLLSTHAIHSPQTSP